MSVGTARYLNMLAGAWLFVSAFLWSHSQLEWANTLVMGIIIIAVSGAAADIPNLRYLDTVCGAWLMLSALYLHVFSAGTRWNNFVVGLIVAMLSLMGRPAGTSDPKSVPGSTTGSASRPRRDERAYP